MIDKGIPCLIYIPTQISRCSFYPLELINVFIKGKSMFKGSMVALVTPYYNKPSQSGLFAHYKTIAENIALPIILYNVPSRTACDLLPETIERLAQIKNIVGIKEATGKIERAEEILTRCGTDFTIYS